MCVKIDLKFSTVCEKMSENRRPQGGGWFFDSHCNMRVTESNHLLLCSNRISSTTRLRSHRTVVRVAFDLIVVMPVGLKSSRMCECVFNQRHVVLQVFDVYEDKKHDSSLAVVNSTRNGRQKQYYVRQFCAFLPFYCVSVSLGLPW